MKRRQALSALASAMCCPMAFAQTTSWPMLVIVGGAEDRLQDRVILKKFVECAGGTSARIRLITSASSDPQAVWLSYRNAFAELGAQDVQPLSIFDKAAAQSSAARAEILNAQGIFITGGDQSKLMQILWETRAYGALHEAFHFNRCCIGGTSAGAAVMSRYMIAQGQAVLRPRKDVTETDIGLGLLSHAVVDQHFSERRRLPRLLSTLAIRPDLLGVGIDEDTALVVEGGKGIEVIGQGAVTLVDLSQMVSNVDELDALEPIEMLGVKLHLLPAGHRYQIHATASGARDQLLNRALQKLVAIGPVRS
jgi:cyanophycinase